MFSGSGKTFTMNGPPDDRGVNLRALDSLFEISQTRSDWNDSISVSILEVYNETIRDLLVAGGGDEKYLCVLKTSLQKNYFADLD